MYYTLKFLSSFEKLSYITHLIHDGDWIFFKNEKFHIFQTLYLCIFESRRRKQCDHTGATRMNLRDP